MPLLENAVGNDAVIVGCAENDRIDAEVGQVSRDGLVAQGATVVRRGESVQDQQCLDGRIFAGGASHGSELQWVPGVRVVPPPEIHQPFGQHGPHGTAQQARGPAVDLRNPAIPMHGAGLSEVRGGFFRFSVPEIMPCGPGHGRRETSRARVGESARCHQTLVGRFEDSRELIQHPDVVAGHAVRQTSSRAEHLREVVECAAPAGEPEMQVEFLRAWQIGAPTADRKQVLPPVQGEDGGEGMLEDERNGILAVVGRREPVHRFRIGEGDPGRVAEHHIGARLLHNRQLPLQLVGFEQVIGIQELDHFPAAGLEARVSCRASSLVRQGQAAHAVAEGSDHLQTAIGRPVVRDDDLDRGVRLRQGAPYRVAHEVLAVVAGDDDADEGCGWLGHGKEQKGVMEREISTAGEGCQPQVPATEKVLKHRVLRGPPFRVLPQFPGPRRRFQRLAQAPAQRLVGRPSLERAQVLHDERARPLCFRGHAGDAIQVKGAVERRAALQRPGHV